MEMNGITFDELNGELTEIIPEPFRDEYFDRVGFNEQYEAKFRRYKSRQHPNDGRTNETDNRTDA